MRFFIFYPSWQIISIQIFSLIGSLSMNFYSSFLFSLHKDSRKISLIFPNFVLIQRNLCKYHFCRSVSLCNLCIFYQYFIQLSNRTCIIGRDKGKGCTGRPKFLLFSGFGRVNFPVLHPVHWPCPLTMLYFIVIVSKGRLDYLQGRSLIVYMLYI